MPHMTESLRADMPPALLPAGEAVRHLASSIGDTLEGIIQHREAHRLPVFRMDKSLINAPPPPAAQELIEGLKSSSYSPWEMGPAEGLMTLRQEISRWRSNLYDERITAENVLITPGATAAFFLSVLSVVRPGQAVMLMTPCFPSYLGAVQVHGAEVLKLPLRPENDFEPMATQVESLWTAETRAVAAVSPNNPTGTILGAHCLQTLERVAHDRSATLIVDETFAPLDLRPESGPAHRFSLPTTVTLGSFSEAFSLADLRVGYIIAARGTICQMSALQGCLSGGVSARAQEVAFAALRQRDQHLSSLIPKLRERDASISNALQSVDGIGEVHGYAGPYKWVKTAVSNTKQLAVQLAEETGIIVRPGSDYGQEGWIRIAFGMIRDTRQFAEALSRLKRFKGWSTQNQAWDRDARLPSKARYCARP